MQMAVENPMMAVRKGVIIYLLSTWPWVYMCVLCSHRSMVTWLKFTLTKLIE